MKNINIIKETKKHCLTSFKSKILAPTDMWVKASLGSGSTNYVNSYLPIFSTLDKPKTYDVFRTQSKISDWAFLAKLFSG